MTLFSVVLDLFITLPIRSNSLSNSFTLACIIECRLLGIGVLAVLAFYRQNLSRRIRRLSQFVPIRCLCSLLGKARLGVLEVHWTVLAVSGFWVGVTGYITKILVVDGEHSVIVIETAKRERDSFLTVSKK